MKQILKLTAFILLMGIVIFISCKKELHCENCIGLNSNSGENKNIVANAGSDQTISLPQDSTLLDGSASTNGFGRITRYAWRKLEGFSSTVIDSPSAVKTMVRTLRQGVYSFELIVYDDKGFNAIDTVLITVYPAGCDNSNRSKINVKLLPIGNLSLPRSEMAVASAGTKNVFAGGYRTAGCPDCWGTSFVDIYDTVSKRWSTALLSKGRYEIATAAVGNLIFFAGGEWGDGAFDEYYSNVDIYDASTNKWSVAHLSEARSKIAAATVGDKIFFAGGEKNWNYDVSERIDIYHLETQTWTTSELNGARAYATAVTANNKIYFAGGTIDNRWKTPFDGIDVYDNSTNTWSRSYLKEPKFFMAGVNAGNKIYFAGGYTNGFNNPSCTVEIKDILTQASSITYLSRPGVWWNNSSQNAI